MEKLPLGIDCRSDCEAPRKKRRKNKGTLIKLVSISSSAQSLELCIILIMKRALRALVCQHLRAACSGLHLQDCNDYASFAITCPCIWVWDFETAAPLCGFSPLDSVARRPSRGRRSPRPSPADGAEGSIIQRKGCPDCSHPHPALEVSRADARTESSWRSRRRRSFGVSKRKVVLGAFDEMKSKSLSMTKRCNKSLQ